MSTTTTQTTQEVVSVPQTVTATNSKNYKITERGSHNIAYGLPHPYPIPKFEDKHEEREWLKKHTAGAFRVFARKDFTEGSAGHISVRDPVDPNTFWINPLGKHFGLIKSSDLVHVDEHGNILPDGNQAAINAAGFAIHSALHKARPNINAACHTHSIYGKAYSTFGTKLEMINQDSCAFYNNHSVYEDFGGVAIEAEEGKAIAAALGNNNNAAILQNHGLLTVGSTVDEAAHLFTLMERTCQAQLLADAAQNEGKRKKFIGEEEAKYTSNMETDPETLYADFQPDLEFEIYKNPDFLN